MREYKIWRPTYNVKRWIIVVQDNSPFHGGLYDVSITENKKTLVNSACPPSKELVEAFESVIDAFENGAEMYLRNGDTDTIKLP